MDNEQKLWCILKFLKIISNNNFIIAPIALIHFIDACDDQS